MSTLVNHSTKSQCNVILDGLLRGLTITSLEAMQELGCCRLASRINDLKKEGYRIVSTMKKENGKRFAIYSMERDNA